MTSQEEKVKSTLELAEKVGTELLNIAPKAVLEINLLDLTMMQLKVVIFLILNGPANMGVLADRLNLGLSTATGIIDRLVKLNIVTRENVSSDRRVVICRLTEKGSFMIDNAWKVVLEQLRHLLMEIPEEKLTLVDQVMELLLMAGQSAQQKTLMDKSLHI